jgi:hypothetical protein
VSCSRFDTDIRSLVNNWPSGSGDSHGREFQSRPFHLSTIVLAEGSRGGACYYLKHFRIRLEWWRFNVPWFDLWSGPCGVWDREATLCSCGLPRPCWLCKGVSLSFLRKISYRSVMFCTKKFEIWC